MKVTERQTTSNYEFNNKNIITKNKNARTAILINALFAGLIVSVVMGLSLAILSNPITVATVILGCLLVKSSLVVLTSKEIIEINRKTDNLKNFLEFKKEHSKELPENKKVILVLESGYDHNNAFSCNDQEIFENLEEKLNCIIIFKKVFSNNDIFQSIEDVVDHQNKITTLWIRAHGNPEGIRLSQDEIFDCEKLKPSLEKLDQKAFIVLQSCKTGGATTTDKVKNIAEKIADTAIGRTIIAPSLPIRAKTTTLSNDPKKLVKMNIKGRDVAKKFKTKITKKNEDDPKNGA